MASPAVIACLFGDATMTITDHLERFRLG